MEIDKEYAAQLGFPKSQYMAIERERRWLCSKFPTDKITRTEVIKDLYVTGTRLRLRSARPTDGGTAMLRFSRKSDADIHTRLITSIYLSEDEFEIMASSLIGVQINKLRHRLNPLPGVMMLVDEFQGDLSGLILVEAEFDTPYLLSSFPTPDFVIREVTDDLRYTGGYLIKNGIPEIL